MDASGNGPKKCFSILQFLVEITALIFQKIPLN